jgi:phosphate transport system substrate-binding protein
MKKALSIAIAILVGSAVVFAAGGNDKKAVKLSGTFTFGGSTTVQPIANVAIEQFVKANPGVKISYEGVGSGAGLKQLGEGTLSLAGSSRDLKQSELDAGLVPVVIARDAIVAVVNKDISVANLTKVQLAGIYAGTITNWKDVGGKDEKIVVVNRDETSGTYGPSRKWSLIPASSPTPRTRSSPRKTAKSPRRSPPLPAPSVMSDSFRRGNHQGRRQGSPVDGVEASVETVHSATYPISRSLYLATKGTAKDGSVEKLSWTMFSRPRKGHRQGSGIYPAQVITPNR